MKKTGIFILALFFVISLSAAAQAAIYWTDLTRVDGKTVYGDLAIGANTVGVTITNSANNAFVQTGGGTYYWTGTAYTIDSVNYAPPTTDLIALSQGGTITVTFDQAVTNPIFALTSWNGNTVDFGTAISFLSYGPGYWGNGTPVINAGGTGFYGSGEVHGLLQVAGTFTSIAFTNTSESWHGFTVGAENMAPVPLPPAIVLLAPGLAGLAVIRRRLKK